MKELCICPEFQEMIWSFAEKDDEKEVSSMETDTINSSSKVSCENAKSEKQSQTDESLSCLDNLTFFCPRTGQTEFVEVLQPTSSQGIGRNQPSLETLPMEMLDLVIKQLDIESKKNLRLANRYFLEMMTKLEKFLMKHWKFKEMTECKLKRLADQVYTVKGIDLEMFNEEYYGKGVSWQYLLKEHRELESVKIGRSEFTYRSLQAIFSHQSMKSIYLEDCRIIGKIDVTTTKIALKVLKLVDCNDIDLLCILNMINGEGLTELDLSENYSDISKISSCATTFPNLEVLNLMMSNITEENLKAFLERSGDKLKKINLGHTEISLASIGSLPITFPWLEELNLGYCSDLTDAGFISLLNMVGVQLAKLDIEGSRISLSQADSLISSFPKLTYLNIERCRSITDSGFLSLLNRAGCGNSLRYLNAVGTNVSATCVSDIRARYPNIRLLYIS